MNPALFKSRVIHDLISLDHGSPLIPGSLRLEMKGFIRILNTQDHRYMNHTKIVQVKISLGGRLTHTFRSQSYH